MPAGAVEVGQQASPRWRQRGYRQQHGNALLGRAEPQVEIGQLQPHRAGVGEPGQGIFVDLGRLRQTPSFRVDVGHVRVELYAEAPELAQQANQLHRLVGLAGQLQGFRLEQQQLGVGWHIGGHALAEAAEGAGGRGRVAHGHEQRGQAAQVFGALGQGGRRRRALPRLDGQAVQPPGLARRQRPLAAALDVPESAVEEGAGMLHGKALAQCRLTLGAVQQMLAVGVLLRPPQGQKELTQDDRLAPTADDEGLP